MTPAAPRCPTCGAFLASNVCSVCPRFPDPLPRSAVAGAALLGLIAGGLAAAGWAGLLWWKWHRWLGLFGRTGEPPEQADARSMALAVGLLVFAVAWVGSTALVAWSGRR